MKTNELFENKSSKQLTRAEKDAKRQSGRTELEKQANAARALKQDAFDKMHNPGGRKIIKLPVVVAGNKVEEQEFIIDDYLKQVHAMQGVKLKDMSKAPVLPGERKPEAAYIVAINNKHVDASVAAHLHGLPPRTRRKPGYAKNDFRREVYDA